MNENDLKPHDPKNIVCLYHKACSDGQGSAWVVWKRYPEATFIAVTYDEPVPPEIDGKDVYIVDFSYKFEPMCDLIERANSVVLLDHHEGIAHTIRNIKQRIALGWQKDKLVELHFDNDHSGAMITWDWFNPGVPPPRLIEHIEDRDLFRFALPKTKEIMASLNVYDWDIAVIDRFVRLDPMCANMAAAGAPITQLTETNTRYVLENCVRTMELGGYTVQVANCPYWLRNEVCDALAETNPFTATYHDTPEYRVFSLRSKKGKGMDVIPIAKLYGGSGHRHACGFRVPRDHLLAQL